MKSYNDLVYSEKLRPSSQYPAQLSEYLFNRYKLNGSLLDVGCGRGESTKAFKDLGLEVKGVDICETKSKFLKGIEVKIMKEEDPFPYADNSFNCVFAKSVIEHLWTPEFFLKECRRVLKPDGILICMAPDWQTQFKIFYNDQTHKRPFTKMGLEMAVLSAEFKDVNTEVFYQLPLVWKYPILKTLTKPLQHFPVRKLHKNKTLRFLRELMILTTGIK